LEAVVISKKIFNFRFLAMLWIFLFSATTWAYEVPRSKGPAVNNAGIAQLQKLSSGVAAVAQKANKAIVFLSVYKKTRASGRGGIEPFDFFFGPRPGQSDEKPSPSGKKRQGGVGSGFFIDLNKGYILTNNHVISGADEIELKLANGRSYKGTVVGRDKNTDIAIVKIKNTKFDRKGLDSLKLANSDKLRVGDFVVALGAPYGLEASLSFGVVSALGRGNLDIANLGNFIQTDAAINPGNSGGPLMSIDGNVIGINTAIYSKTGGYNGIGFAIPSNLVANIASQLISTGSIQRGYLGVWMKPLDEELRKGLDIPEGFTGTLIYRVARNSPADRAGIEAGDVIVEIDGKTTKDSGELSNIVGLKKPGASMRLALYRDGKKRVIKVTASKHPEDRRKALKNAKSVPFGLTLNNWSPQLKKDYSLTSKNGVIVRYVTPGSAGDRSGLYAGDVILKIDGKNIKSIKEFYSKCKKKTRVLVWLERNSEFYFLTLRK
jgi:serine protease Do